MERIENTDKKIMGGKIRGGLLTGALGDALGIPTEMRKQEYIKEKFGRVNDFLPAKESFLLSRQGFDEEGIGFYSDDTVLTFAIAKSISKIGGIDIQDIWKEQMEGYKNYPYGFGSGTKFAFDKIEEGIAVEEIINLNGGGNGMMMKQFPLAAYFALNNIDREEEEKIIIDLSKASHGHPAALVAAIVHHNLLKNLLKSDNKNIDKKYLLEELIQTAEEQEIKFENREGKKISEVLKNIYSYMDDKGNINLSDEEIMKDFGWIGHMKNSGFITTTIGIVYCLFFRNIGMQGVRDAVNFGGDTDTYASIIGNMTGALHGEIYDEKLLDKVQNIEELKSQVNDFILKILG